MLVISAMVVNEFRSTAGKTCRAAKLPAPHLLPEQRVRAANASFGVNVTLFGCYGISLSGNAVER
jgi:hypothetical protein